MNLDTRIKETFARHETDVHARTGVWSDVERRIARSHRRRAAAAGMGTVLAIAAAVIVIPRIGEHQRPPTATSDWKTIESKAGGYRFLYPPDWTALEGDGATDIYPPGPPEGPEGKTTFHVRADIETSRYSAPETEPEGTKSSGSIDGHRYLRYEFTTSEKVLDAIRVAYRIDWPGPAATCRSAASCPQPSYTLALSILARNEDLWDKYGPTAERIVRTAEAIPSSRKTFVRPVVTAKIPVRVMVLASSREAIWGIAESPGDGKPGSLVKIDPATNRVVARIPVGYAPADLAAGAGAIWVVNGNACPVVGGCGQGGEGARPTVAPGMQDSVWRIDEDTNRVVAKIDMSGALTVTTTIDAVWVGRGKQVVRIDPATNRVAGQISIQGENPFRMAAGEGWVWVLAAKGTDRVAISRIDPVAKTFHDSFDVSLGASSPDIAVGLGAAWVTNVEESRLARISRDDSNDVVRIDVPDAAPIGVAAVATGNGYVWVAGGRGQLFQFDPSTNAAVGDPLTVGENPPVGVQDLLTGFDSVWVASDDGNVWRLGP